ncbi:hypothetical protein ACTMS0_23780 [Micromonospora sp. H33]|uniref:hypothetical protein n=1 Tax=Micromonospora sp. H33 TaxID=3452215 RepID=UPI003F8BDFCE
MIRLRSILAVAGAAVATTAALPATPAAADTVDRYAHAHFDGAGSMYVDVHRPATGATTVDVEWQDSTCGPVGDLYVCDSVSRRAYDVPVTRFAFSLSEANLAATVPYRETRRHCEFVDETENCTEETGAGTTTLRVTWTATAEPYRERYTGEDGTVYITTRSDTTVSGSGFGSTYDDPTNSFGVLSRVRTIPPAA